MHWNTQIPIQPSKGARPYDSPCTPMLDIYGTADLDVGGLHGEPEVEEEEGGDEDDARGDAPHDGRHEEEADGDGDARQHGDDEGAHLVDQVGEH